MTLEMMNKLNGLLNNPFIMSVFSESRQRRVCKVCEMPVCGRRCDRRMIVDQLTKEIEDVRSKGNKSNRIQNPGAKSSAQQEADAG